MANGLLQGKTALVTGASRGVGAAIAEALAREGAFVCLAARSEQGLQETADKCRAAGAAGVAVHPADLSDPASVDRLAEDVLRGRHVDVLVNNAGAYPESGLVSVLEGDPNAWDKTLAVNVSGPMRLTRRLAPGMAARGGGWVLTVSSVAGRKGSADEAAYAASKWAIRGFSLGCYEALAQAGVKAVLLEPAHVATDMAAAQGGGSRYAEVKPELMIQPEDVAEAALLAFRLGPKACPSEIVVNRLQTPYEEK